MKAQRPQSRRMVLQSTREGLSADSMQLYKGLDVITNKVTQAEMGGIDHWGLDLVQPGQGINWELGRWCGEADKMVSSLDMAGC
jgi:tRNA dimethylallyltransferase